MLNIHDLTVSFAGEDLFSAISYKLEKGDRVGLIGKNGAGKSTMLKVISGELSKTSGTIALAKEISIGFLKQDLEFEKGRTVLEEAYQAFEEVQKIESDLNKVQQEINERTDYETASYLELINELTELTERYEMVGGYDYQGKTEKILLGLGFQRNQFNQLTETFSGGWRMRIELAKLLLASHDILLLDEPTNHLDIESIIWLEKFLINYSGALVLVSHDKMFLDNVTNRTIEISFGKIYDYKKPYSQFLLLRDEIRNQQILAKKNQDKEIKQKQELIDKFRAKANKASMAQSLIKQLDKIQRIEVDAVENATMNIKLPVSITPGKVVVNAENVGKAYGDHQVFSEVTFMVERGSKIAFVGQNGQGKSTLAKMIVDEVKGEGQLNLGHNVQIGYFAQNQSEYLDGELTLLDTMEMAANDENRAKVRDYLGAFLFSGDHVDKKVKVLSGGERNRLALCKMLLSPFNVLVMDEPTNHLDIQSKEVLKKALLQFEGTLIVVSHDRDFLQGLTEQVYGFKEGKVKTYLGDIDYFLEENQLENIREAEKQSVEQKTEKVSSSHDDKNKQKEWRKLQNKLSNIEKKITQLENEIIDLDAILLEQPNITEDQPDFFENYQSKKDTLVTYMEDWEKLENQMSAWT